MLLPKTAIPSHRALEEGYRPLTILYALPKERALLDGVQRDMDKGGIQYVLVNETTDTDKVSIWRKNMRSLTETCAVKIPLEVR